MERTGSVLFVLTVLSAMLRLQQRAQNSIALVFHLFAEQLFSVRVSTYYVLLVPYIITKVTQTGFRQILNTHLQAWTQ